MIREREGREIADERRQRPSVDQCHLSTTDKEYSEKDIILGTTNLY